MRLHPAGAAPDALAGSVWECFCCPPDAVTGLEGLAATGSGAWVPAPVPGTVAEALRHRGSWSVGEDDQPVLDGRDWWYRCRFAGPGEGEWELELGGLATIADVWLNGVHLLHSENMWRSYRVPVGRLGADNLLVLRFAALLPRLAEKRPRPRWRSLMLRSPTQRWFRTSLLGRVAGRNSSSAPVGPWRPLHLRRIDDGVTVAERTVDVVVETTGEGAVGLVDVRMVVDGIPIGSTVEVRLDDLANPAVVAEDDGRAVVETRFHVPRARLWWPHTHGDQPLAMVRLVAGDDVVDVASVGFRTVRAERGDGGFTLVVNGEPVFCRGANWTPPDAVALRATPDAVRDSLQKVVAAGMNMVRISGDSTYEDSAFWDVCDELGILVWQDCMIAGFDPPEDPGFEADLHAELDEQLVALQGRPSLAVVCGSSDSQQQAAMFGLPADRRHSHLLEEAIPEWVAAVLPGVPYVASAPTGGDPPFDPAVGVATYFGVGAYLQPVSDVRSAGVRFAAECLAFAVPPEPSSVERSFGSGAALGGPGWKAGVPRDSGASWDFEDVRDEYVRTVFGVDPLAIRHTDPDRALDYGRAVVVHLMSTVMTEWRCRRSGCAGALVLNWQDTVPGAGWGLLDASGTPKAPWFALGRALAPVAVLLTDDHLSGVGVHVVNDRPEPVVGGLRITLFDLAGNPLEEEATTVEVPARSQRHWSTAELLGGFRDLTNAYRFGPPAFDVVRVDLDVDGTVRESIHLPGGVGRPVEADLGLEAVAVRRDGTWAVTVRTRRFAQWVALDLPGFLPSDSWFHLAPGSERTVTLRATGGDDSPKGRIRALNGLRSVPVTVPG